MSLVDSYLLSVEAYLPREDREDIIQELRDELSEQITARASSAMDVSLAQHEREVLAGLGHPLKVASSYRPNRYFIGPELYPAFLQTLRSTLGLALGLGLVLGIAFGPAESAWLTLKGGLNIAFEIGLWVLAGVTLTFYWLESEGEKLDWYHNWNPDQLSVDRKPLSYSDVGTNLATEGVFLIWWNSLLDFSLLNGAGARAEWLSAVELAPVWDLLFWPVNGVLGALFVVHLITLLQGVWQRRWVIAELVLNALLLVVLLVFVSAEARLLLAGEAAGSTEVGFSLQWADQTLRFIAVFVGVFTVWDGVLGWRRLR